MINKLYWELKHIQRKYKVHLKSYVRVLKIKNRRPNILGKIVDIPVYAMDSGIRK